MNKWDSRYICVAKTISEWSKDPSSKIGAVIVGSKGQIMSQGYNGFPRGIDDTDDRLNKKELKYKYVVHAEMNAIYNATYNNSPVDGCTLYVYGLPVCNECAKGIIQVGIKRVVCLIRGVVSDKWKESSKFTEEMFKESGVSYEVFYES